MAKNGDLNLAVDTAALQCFNAATDTYGMDYLELSAAARREFFGIDTTPAKLLKEIWGIAAG